MHKDAPSESFFLNPSKALRRLHLQTGMKVADFGTGSGFFARAAAREGAHVWALDADRELLKRLKTLALAEGLKRIDIVAGDLEHRGGSHLPDETMDVVIAANVFFSAHDKDALAEEMWRVLRKNGRALIIDWKDSFGGIGPHPTHVFSEQAARNLFGNSGFSHAEEEIDAGAYHWGFVTRKKISASKQVVH